MSRRRQQETTTMTTRETTAVLTSVRVGAVITLEWTCLGCGGHLAKSGADHAALALARSSHACAEVQR